MGKYKSRGGEVSQDGSVRCVRFIRRWRGPAARRGHILDRLGGGGEVAGGTGSLERRNRSYDPSGLVSSPTPQFSYVLPFLSPMLRFFQKKKKIKQIWPRDPLEAIYFPVCLNCWKSRGNMPKKKKKK